MPDPNTASPVRYDPALEHIADDEQETTREIAATMAKIREKTYADSGHALRSVHAKSHGFVTGRLTVADGLPPELAQGLFAKPGTFAVVMRFSTNPGDILDDKVSAPRGLAVKVIGVEGERLPGSEGQATQDWVLINGPAFSAPGPKQFLSSLKKLAATTDKAEGAKKALSATLQAAEKVLEAFGGQSTTLVSMGGQPETNVLGETYYSQAPLRHGDHVAKLAVAPASDGLKALTDAPVDLDDRPNGLRDAVVDFFARNGAEWNVQVQLCTDLDKMPIEDASVVWPQDLSPYVTVARITAGPQDAWNDERAKAIDDGMLFTPWHGLAAHRPLDAVMRSRKMAYEASARFRAEKNGRKIDEPSGVDGLD